MRHAAVEHGAGCAAADRLGPYADEAAARQAPERAAQRSAGWDDDPRWNDPRADPESPT